LAVHLSASLLDAPCEVVDTQTHRIELRRYRKLATGNTSAMVGRRIHPYPLPRFCAKGMPMLTRTRGGVTSRDAEFA